MTIIGLYMIQLKYSRGILSPGCNVNQAMISRKIFGQLLLFFNNMDY